MLPGTQSSAPSAGYRAQGDPPKDQQIEGARLALLKAVAQQKNTKIHRQMYGMDEPGPNKAGACTFAKNILLHLCKPGEDIDAFLAANCVRSFFLPASNRQWATRLKFTRQIGATH